MRYAAIMAYRPRAQAFTFSDGSVLTSSKLLYRLDHPAGLMIGTDTHIALHSLQRCALQACAAAGLVQLKRPCLGLPIPI